jgi:beta-fructofuranosidase
MYFGRGFAGSEIGDTNLIAHEGRLHLFHVTLPSHDVVSHLVSDDGVHWQQLPYALRVGDPGEFDDDQIWTMGTFAWQGKFYMLYTALKQSEDGAIQRTGLAVSDDLIRWEKVENNPVAAADARWYETGTSDSGREDWRDPFVFIEYETLHAIICAHEKTGPQNRRGCVGHFVSEDSLNWEVRSPFYTPRVSSDWEVPTLFKLGAKYFLLGHQCAPPQDVYRVADSLEGPWQRPTNDWILPSPCYIFTPVEWRGRTLLYHFIHTDFDWPETRRIVGPSNCSRAIAPPKEAVATESGELILRSCRFIWDELATIRSTPALKDAPQNAFSGDWKFNRQSLEANSQIGMGVAFLSEEYSDFVLEITMELGNAAEAGVLWRSDDEADAATFASLIPGRARIELQRVLKNPPLEPKRFGRGFSTLQENHLPLKRGQSVRLRVVVWGPYIEISANDRVLLCHLTMSRRTGKIGFFTTDGSATFSDVTLQTLQPPPMREAEL